MRLIILAAMLAVTTAASAQSADDLPDQPIARSEVLNVVKRQFAAMDRDRDGFVTEAEFEAYRARDVQTGNSQLAAFDDLGRRWFERADEDGDGRVTLREARS